MTHPLPCTLNTASHVLLLHLYHILNCFATACSCYMTITMPYILNATWHVPLLHLYHCTLTTLVPLPANVAWHLPSPVPWMLLYMCYCCPCCAPVICVVPLLHNLCNCLFMLHDFYYAMYLEWYFTCATARLVLYLELLCHSMLMLHDVTMTYSLYTSSHVSLVSLLYLCCTCCATSSTCYMTLIMPMHWMLLHMCHWHICCATVTPYASCSHVTSYCFHDYSRDTYAWLLQCDTRIPTKYYIVTLMHDYYHATLTHTY